MKKYSFRLNNVLRIRRIEESVAKSELAKANNEVQNAIAAVEQRVADYEASLTATAMTRSTVDSFMRTRYFNELSSKAVIAAKVARNSAAAEAAIKRAAFTESARKVKALDRLDERAREDYALEAQREADRELDDLVTSRFPRPLRTAI